MTACSCQDERVFPRDAKAHASASSRDNTVLTYATFLQVKNSGPCYTFVGQEDEVPQYFRTDKLGKKRHWSLELVADR